MRKRTHFYVFIACVVILLLLLAGMISSVLRKNRDQALTSDGIAYLESLENRNPADVNAQILAARSTQAPTLSIDLPQDDTQPAPTTEAAAENEEPSLPEDPDLPSDPETTAQDEPLPLSDTVPWENPLMTSWKSQIESAEIITLTDEERAAYRARLANCVVIGDSMAQSVLEYGFLDSSHVFYRRGYAIGQLTDAIAEAEAMLPQTIIFFTGLNDTDYYATPESYAQDYQLTLENIRAQLPEVPLFVCSMLPPSNALGAVRPDLARADIYDEALHRMCDSIGVTYIDTKWMVNQSLYLDDGLHFVSSFYDIWIQYIALRTGL